jgi:hypothetical protein
VDAHERWLSIVEEYSAKMITHPTDRLPALSGIAQIMQERTGDEYIAGLWRRDLVAGLLWARVYTRSRASTYVAPTWSWASFLGPIASFDAHRRHLLELDIPNIVTELASANAFGVHS